MKSLKILGTFRQSSYPCVEVLACCKAGGTDKFLHTAIASYKDVFVQVEWIHIGMGLACDSAYSSVNAGNQAEKVLLLIVTAVVDFHMGHPVVRAVRAALPGEPQSRCLM